MDNAIKKAAEAIRRSGNLISLTGAGISVESGIPDFRSAGGLWEKYDPSIYATIETFKKDPRMSWDMIFDMIGVTADAEPNPGHYALAELESLGYLKGIITQNIDNLHQRAGSTRVVEYHGNATRLECLGCHGRFGMESFNIAEKEIPRCPKCNRILKPAVIFFGEMIPRSALLDSNVLTQMADAVLVVGTSAIVYPAAGIPFEAKKNGAVIIEVNVERTPFSSHITDIFIEGQAGEMLPLLVRAVKGS